ncbi:HD-GYP domain-containing protein [Vibrio algarum]|uniref:HD domain-containing protein n=1 Tax=Vibrio algarum TaxID=3020714 RepID=A0ABT4YPP6_9VIBR|nr:HD domain-containing phosphohydrolase [Vibrio sp. KJ40-1]MDB1123526.1 HD domain-containing protein [Vibrio sp. KJ40-1]
MLKTINERIESQDDTVVGPYVILLESDVLLLLASLPLMVLFIYGIYVHINKARFVTQGDKSLKEVKQEALTLPEKTISMLGKMIECRSGETGGHVKRVANMSFYVAKLYGLTDSECELLKVISPMHDIGKIAVSDSILNKPSKLDEAEFEIMKRHTIDGYKLLSSSNSHFMKMAAIVAHEHHEKWDGTGYPNGKAALEIHIYGRITAIVDVIDALLSQRPYKEPWSESSVKTLLKDQSGKHFEPQLVDLVINNFSTVISVRNATIEENQIAILNGNLSAA